MKIQMNMSSGLPALRVLTRERWLRIFLLFSLLLVLNACQKKVAVAVSTAAASTDLRRADAYFEAGDHAEAASAYEAYLLNYPALPNRDHVLFRLGLTYAFPESPIHEAGRAAGLFRKLVDLFPKSPYAIQARFLLYLQSEAARMQTEVARREERIKQLSDELEKLKQIDMQRRPSRPP